MICDVDNLGFRQWALRRLLRHIWGFTALLRPVFLIALFIAVSCVLTLLHRAKPIEVHVREDSRTTVVRVHVDVIKCLAGQGWSRIEGSFFATMLKKLMHRIPIPTGDTDGNASNSQPNYKRAPKSRRPSAVRDYVTKSLPASSGPYDVGSIDLEVPVERRAFGIERDGKEALLLETVLVTIFYPIKLGITKTAPTDGARRWSRQLWLNKSRASMARGYGSFSGVNKTFCQVFFTSTVGLTKLPVWRNAPLAQHFPAEGNVHESGVEVREREAEDALDRPPIFPLVLFSHGLGGTRTTYSALCGEYASYGWICCAIEHRDGSGPRTFVNYADGRPARIVDYVNPENGENDTSNEVATDHKLRNAQIAMRKAEVHKVYEIMCRINDGDGEDVARENLRLKRPGIIGGTSRGTVGVDWNAWKGRLQVDNVIMCGHSFGGATTHAIIRTPSMLKYIKYAILLDVWGQAIPPHPQEDEQDDIGVPVLMIGSESFLYWEENVKIMFDIARKISQSHGKIWMFTLRGSFHLSFSDFGILWPHLFKILFNTKIDPQRAIDVMINASFEFFRHVMGHRVARWNRASDEGLLNTPISDKWRNVQGKRNDWRHKMARDSGDENEIWMHITPDSGMAGIEGHTVGGTDASAKKSHVSDSKHNTNTASNKAYARSRKTEQKP